MKITLFNSENIKIIVVILIIGIIFVYLVCKKKKRVERFYNIDKNILCIKYNDVEEIKNFRLNMGYEISPENIKSNIIKLDKGQPIEEGKNIPINYRYDFIQIEVNTLEKRKDDFVISPTGIIFDPTNDDIIVFDIYKLRRFQYRLNRSKFDILEFDIRNNKNLVNENDKNYNPRNIEILSEFEKKRKLLYIQVLIYLNEIINDAKTYISFEKDKNELEKILEDQGTDNELKKMAESELGELKINYEKIEKRLKIFLLPKDEADKKNAIIEIRAGTGGLEASLFAADLFKMYEKVSHKKKWLLELISISEVMLEVLRRLLLQ